MTPDLKTMIEKLGECKVVVSEQEMKTRNGLRGAAFLPYRESGYSWGVIDQHQQNEKVRLALLCAVEKMEDTIWNFENDCGRAGVEFLKEAKREIKKILEEK